MLVYPQLDSGALSQFPIQKRRTLRTVVNRAADCSIVKLADPGATITEWSLTYKALTDQELAALEEFFCAAEGSLNEFTFLDPTANLLSWSDQLDHAVWQRDPMLSIAGGVPDAGGGNRGWHVDNTGAASQALIQTVSAPASYVYCLSLYVRGTAPLQIELVLGAGRFERAVTNEWTRVVATGTGPANFGLEIPAGCGLDVFGMQAEVQASPSIYRPSTTGGVYEGARLRDDEFRVTTTGVDQHSCTVTIIHADHI